jgi:hypothetical protein
MNISKFTNPYVASHNQRLEVPFSLGADGKFCKFGLDNFLDWSDQSSDSSERFSTNHEAFGSINNSLVKSAFT